MDWLTPIYRLAISWWWAGYRLASGWLWALSDPGYQLPMGWLSAIYRLAIGWLWVGLWAGWLWAGYGLVIGYILAGYGLVMDWLWAGYGPAMSWISAIYWLSIGWLPADYGPKSIHLRHSHILLCTKVAHGCNQYFRLYIVCSQDIWLSAGYQLARATNQYTSRHSHILLWTKFALDCNQYLDCSVFMWLFGYQLAIDSLLARYWVAMAQINALQDIVKVAHGCKQYFGL